MLAKLRRDLFLLPTAARTLLWRMSWRPLLVCYGVMLLVSLFRLGVDVARHSSVTQMGYDTWTLSLFHLQLLLICWLYLLVWVRPRLLPAWQQALYQQPLIQAGLRQLHAQPARTFYAITVPSLVLLAVMMVVLCSYGFTMMMLDDFVYTGLWPWFYTHAVLFALLTFALAGAYWVMMYLCLKQRLLHTGLKPISGL
ncbi:hypothetical protein LVJ82_06935 [Vitreoscilla massiliensis]|uniref:Uncharacterized protein n=1 Tax=Vitreoscilla massiliensis TaxID=1689272 RepID=A0ABY4E5Q7_9NEIS|nr:hypothetical protein [Vitreoscilla massiliensis]UOO90695.1 hypothetical protein LVJ82_06935 [Vitreoscilla massiliensis]